MVDQTLGEGGRIVRKSANDFERVFRRADGWPPMNCAGMAINKAIVNDLRMNDLRINDLRMTGSLIKALRIRILKIGTH